MSTRKLSRSIVEGGRANRSERRAEIKSERAEQKAFLAKCVLDPEYSDEDFITEMRPVRKEFNDRFGAFTRYIDSNIGRSWNNVYSELKEKFSEESMKDWHMMLHMKQSIDIHGEYKVGFYWPTYYVDSDHILRKRKKEKFKFKADLSQERANDIVRWLDKRFIHMVDGVLYWYVRENREETVQVTAYYARIAYSIYSNNSYAREDGRLTPEEVNYFRALPERVREKLLNYKDNLSYRMYLY